MLKVRVSSHPKAEWSLLVRGDDSCNSLSQLVSLNLISPAEPQGSILHFVAGARKSPAVSVFEEKNPFQTLLISPISAQPSSSDRPDSLRMTYRNRNQVPTCRSLRDLSRPTGLAMSGLRMEFQSLSLPKPNLGGTASLALEIPGISDWILSPLTADHWELAGVGGEPPGGLLPRTVTWPSNEAG